jgi:hypothetical protein
MLALEVLIPRLPDAQGSIAARRKVHQAPPLVNTPPGLVRVRRAKWLAAAGVWHTAAGFCKCREFLAASGPNHAPRGTKEQPRVPIRLI